MNSLQSSVIQVLTSSSIGRMRDFKIGAHSIQSALYTNLGTLIKSNLNSYFSKNAPPYIKYYPGLDSSGQYEPKTNTLWFKFPVAKTLTQKSVIVHEATHAALDMLNVSTIMIGEAEALSYVAQCQYFILNNDDPSVRLTDEKAIDEKTGEIKISTPKDRVFEQAMYIASELLQFRTPTANDYFQLRQAVSNDPEYYSDFFTLADYHGIS